MPGRRDERGWEEVAEEVAKDGLRTRCCQTGPLILAPLLISSVTEGKSLNPSGFGFHQCSPEASSVSQPQQKAQPSPASAPVPSAGTGRARGWAAGWHRPTTGEATYYRRLPVHQQEVIRQRGTSVASTMPAQLKMGSGIK